MKNEEYVNQGMIEFDGHVIKYPNGNKIYINLDKDYNSYTYDVCDEGGDCIRESLCLIHQAHMVAVNGGKNEK